MTRFLRRRRRTLFRLSLLGPALGLLVFASGCASAASAASAVAAVASAPRAEAMPPAMLLGAFADDYDNSFRISDSLFEQLPSGRFWIVEWNTAGQFLIARNDSSNPSDGGRWTRIDWMPFTGMAPYAWGFCMTAYRAPTEAAARATAPADRTAPRVGCGGHPFSRMRPASPTTP